VAAREPFKIKAQTAVHEAVKRGDILKPRRCETCGAVDQKMNAHHHDYSKPLAVTWICDPCHRFIHRKVWVLTKQSVKI